MKGYFFAALHVLNFCDEYVGEIYALTVDIMGDIMTQHLIPNLLDGANARCMYCHVNKNACRGRHVGDNNKNLPRL